MRRSNILISFIEILLFVETEHMQGLHLSMEH